MSELTFRSRTTSPSNESCQKGALANQLLTELASMLDQDKEAAPSSVGLLCLPYFDPARC